MSSNSLTKSILKSVILRSVKITKSNTSSDCKKILIFGEEILLISENTPIVKITNPKIFKRINPLLKKINEEI